MIYVCEICGWEYDEAKGLPEEGIRPGTKWENLPDKFYCYLCGATKEQFSAAGTAADLEPL